MSGIELARRLKADSLHRDIPISQRVSIDGQTVQLGPKEYKLLAFFMSHRERVYSRSQLLDHIWGGNVYVEERTVDVHIRRLHMALDIKGYHHYIQTIRGSGYRFSNQVYADK